MATGAASGIVTTWGVAVGGFLLDLVADIETTASPLEVFAVFAFAGVVPAAVLGGLAGLVLGSFYVGSQTVDLAKWVTPFLLAVPCLMYLSKVTLNRVDTPAADAVAVGAFTAGVIWVGYNAGVYFESLLERGSLRRDGRPVFALVHFDEADVPVGPSPRGEDPDG